MTVLVWMAAIGCLVLFLAVQIYMWVEHREFMLRLAVRREMQAVCDNEKLNLLIAIYPIALNDCSTYAQALIRISDFLRPLPTN